MGLAVHSRSWWLKQNVSWDSCPSQTHTCWLPEHSRWNGWRDGTWATTDDVSPLNENTHKYRQKLTLRKAYFIPWSLMDPVIPHLLHKLPSLASNLTLLFPAHLSIIPTSGHTCPPVYTHQPLSQSDLLVCQCYFASSALPVCMLPALVNLPVICHLRLDPLPISDLPSCLCLSHLCSCSDWLLVAYCRPVFDCSVW